MIETGNPLDVAIAGDGFFALRAGERIVYSRQGQFRLSDSGTVVSAQGHVLQQAGGGDLVLDNESVEILADGTVVGDGRPLGRIALWRIEDGGELEALGGSEFLLPESAAEVEQPSLRQGMLEASNVVLGDEMTAMMIAMRQAESGARLISVYDDLIGRAITTFGQGMR
jgi:flagellar basal-body rod protein FlgG